VTITNGYCTLAILKTRLGITDSTDDTTLENVVEAVSRWIDGYCRRRFYTSTNDETRYYTPQSSTMCITDDIISVSAITADDTATRAWSTTWAATDYDLMPYNSTPYLYIATTPSGKYRFSPGITKFLKVVGKFGYAATEPDAVNEACLLQSERIFKRKDAPFGVAGSGALGQTLLISDVDPDVKALLAPPIRRVVRV
jgi:hypothetical protein